MKDMSDITIIDEAFFKMTWAKNPEVHVLATRDPANAQCRRPQGRSGAADVDVRTHSRRAVNPPGRSFGCRDTFTPISPITSCSGHCSVELRGLGRSRLMSL